MGKIKLEKWFFLEYISWNHQLYSKWAAVILKLWLLQTRRRSKDILASNITKWNGVVEFWSLIIFFNFQNIVAKIINVKLFSKSFISKFWAIFVAICAHFSPAVSQKYQFDISSLRREFKIRLGYCRLKWSTALICQKIKEP